MKRETFSQIKESSYLTQKNHKIDNVVQRQKCEDITAFQKCEIWSMTTT